MGAFRLCKDGKTVFSEHFLLAEEGPTLVLRLKHFDEKLRGWEPQDKCVEFPLIATLEREARFDGMTYRLVDDNELHVFVAIRDKDKNLREAKFVFHREVG